MPEKLGNGGHGREEYDPNTGKYIADGEPNKVYNNPKEPSYGYHAGDLGKAEQWGKVRWSGRDTGHLGTGTYFISDPKRLGSGYSDRPLQRIDFNSYNLYKPSNQDYGMKLHDALRQINRLVVTASDYLKNRDDIDYLNNFYNKINNENYDFTDEEYKKASIAFNNLIDTGFLNDFDINNNKIIFEAINNNFSWSDKDEEELFDAELNGFDELYEILNERKNRYLNAEKLKKQQKDSLEEQVFTLFQNDSFKKEMSKINDFNNLDELFYDVLEGKNSKEEIQKALNNTIKKYENYSNLNEYDVDSLSTVFMKELGYEGIDVRHIAKQNDFFDNMDSTKYGSVIYDLKGEDLETHKRAKEERQKASQLYGMNLAK